MTEKLPQAYEQESSTSEREQSSVEHDRIALERERSAEQSKLQSVETAKKELEQVLEKHETEKKEAPKHEKAPSVHKASRQARKVSYNKIMKETRAQMPPATRIFSKVIHAPGLEKASEAIGTTIARPNALLAGSFSAFVLVSVLYFWARHNGYPLSGFETIAAFIIGWLAGITFDFTRIMVTGKR